MAALKTVLGHKEKEENGNIFQRRHLTIALEYGFGMVYGSVEKSTSSGEAHVPFEKCSLVESCESASLPAAVVQPL